MRREGVNVHGPSFVEGVGLASTRGQLTPTQCDCRHLHWGSRSEAGLPEPCDGVAVEARFDAAGAREACLALPHPAGLATAVAGPVGGFRGAADALFNHELNLRA